MGDSRTRPCLCSSPAAARPLARRRASVPGWGVRGPGPTAGNPPQDQPEAQAATAGGVGQNPRTHLPGRVWRVPGPGRATDRPTVYARGMPTLATRWPVGRGIPGSLPPSLRCTVLNTAYFYSSGATVGWATHRVVHAEGVSRSVVNPRTRRAVHTLAVWAGGLSMRGICTLPRSTPQGGPGGARGPGRLGCRHLRRAGAGAAGAGNLFLRHFPTNTACLRGETSPFGPRAGPSDA